MSKYFNLLYIRGEDEWINSDKLRKYIYIYIIRIIYIYIYLLSFIYIYKIRKEGKIVHVLKHSAVTLLLCSQLYQELLV